MLKLIIENNMISDQLIKNINAHKEFLSKIIKINKNLEFINDNDDVINSLSYEMQRDEN